jgi:hypothetical protein
MAKKTRPEAFEHQLDAAQSAQLRQWCLRDGYTKAVQQALKLWKIKTSVGALFRWFHKDDSVALLKTLASSAHLAGQIEDAVAKNPNDPLVAAEKAISAIALKTLAGQATREEMELALELFRTAMESRSARTKAAQKEQELELQREKFQRETCRLFLEWYGDKRAQEIAGSDASNEDKIARLRQTYFASVDALEKSGSVKLPD